MAKRKKFDIITLLLIVFLSIIIVTVSIVLLKGNEIYEPSEDGSWTSYRYWDK